MNNWRRFSKLEVSGIRLFYADGLTHRQLSKLFSLTSHQINNALWQTRVYRDVEIKPVHGGFKMRTKDRKQEINEIWRSIKQCSKPSANCSAVDTRKSPGRELTAKQGRLTVPVSLAVMKFLTISSE